MPNQEPNEKPSLLERLSKVGLYLPTAYDARSNSPSITLLIFYVAATISSLSLVSLHFFPKLLTATTMSFLFLGMGFVFYRMRKLDKVKFDLDDKSIEIDAGEEDEKDNSK